MSAGLLLLDVTLRAAVVVAAAGTALWILRPRRAASELAAWTLVLVGLIALPLAMRIVPVIDVLVPAFRGAAVAEMTPGPGAPVQTSSARAAAAETTLGNAASATRGVGFASMIFWMYAAGVVVLLVRIGTGWAVARRFLLATAPVTPGALAARLSGDASSRVVEVLPSILESAALDVPITVGATRPVIVLPSTWRTWPADTLTSVLLHEGAHARRRDTLTVHLALIYRAFTWFSPVGWWLHRRLTVVAERASDEAVLDAGVPQATYAETLLSFFARARAGRGPGVRWHLAMAHRTSHSAVDQRIARILSWKGVPSMSSTRRRSFAVTMVVGSAFALSAAVRLTAVPLQLPQVPEVPAGPASLSSALLDSLASAASAASDASPTRVSPEPARRASGQGAGVPLPTQEQEPEPFRSAIRPGPESGASFPVALRRATPHYTPEAIASKIQGDVELEIVVLANGQVGATRVVTPLEPGLDARAEDAARQWMFAPARVGDRAVDARVKLVLAFKLH